MIINIEVNGLHPKLERKKRFCMLQDKYLKSQGVVIELMEVSSLNRMPDMEVEELLCKTVENAQ